MLIHSDVVKKNFQHSHICARRDGGWNRRSPPLNFLGADPSIWIRDKFKNLQIGEDQREYIDVYCETTKEMIRIERILRGDNDWSKCSRSNQLRGKGKQIAPIRKPPIRKPPKKKRKATTSSSVSATSSKRKSSYSSGNTPLEVKKPKKENDTIVLDSDSEYKSEDEEQRKGNRNLKDDRDYD